MPPQTCKLVLTVRRADTYLNSSPVFLFVQKNPHRHEELLTYVRTGCLDAIETPADDGDEARGVNARVRNPAVGDIGPSVTGTFSGARTTQVLTEGQSQDCDMALRVNEGVPLALASTVEPPSWTAGTPRPCLHPP